MKYTLAAFNARYVHSCPALFAVRNTLILNLPDCTPRLFQCTINDPYYKTLLTLSNSKADAFFFSVYIWNAAYITRLTEDLALLFPERPIILGGPQVSHGDQADWPDNCTIVRGEVEGLSPGFLYDLQAGRLKREYTASPAAVFPSPYRKEDYADHLAKRHVYYESTRGCPFSCSYCLSAAEQGIRRKDLTQVADELQPVLAHLPRSLRFIDRTYNADKKRALEIWRFLAAQAGTTRCHFEIAPDLFNEDMFHFLAELTPGHFEFEIGLQTTNPQSLAAVNRSMDMAKARENIARLVAIDTVHLHLDLILGLPFETYSSFLDSFNAVFALAPHYIQMGLLKVLPGTEIAQRRQEFGLIASHTPPYAILATHWLSHEQISRLFLFGECVEAFYNNRFFRTFFKYIRQHENNYADFFNALLETCLAADFFSYAATQECMTRILCDLANDRPDRSLILEILQYDWLRCGHRFLPDCLSADQSLSRTRDILWQTLPQNLEPFFSHTSRSTFIKQAVFLHFSSAALKLFGHPETDQGCIAFLPEREKSIMQLHRAVLLPETAS